MAESTDTDFELDLTNPQIKQAVDAYAEQVLEEKVAGLRNNSEKLKAEKRAKAKEADELKRYKDLVEEHGGEEAITTMFKSFKEREDSGNSDDPKYKSLEQRLKSIEEEKAKTAKEVDKWKSQFEQEHGQRMSMLRDSQINSAFMAKKEFVPEAVEEAKLLAEKYVKLDEDGSPYVVDQYGEPRTTDGGTPMGVSEWLAELGEKKRYWLKPNAGGGAGGSGGVNGKNLRRSQMTSQQKAAYARDNGTNAYLALPE